MDNRRSSTQAFFGSRSANVHDYVSVQPSRKLDLLSRKSGIGRKLSHQNLTKFVLHAEKEDLGTFDDVLLCLIPVFSIKDRLRNDATFQFDLSGFPERKSWPKAASNYSALLKSMSKSPESVIEDSLILTEVAYALDYIYMMALDAKHSRRDEYTNTNKEAKQQESLGTKNSRTDSNTAKADSMISGQQSTKDLQDLQTYISKAFPGAFKRMWLFYKLQGRAEFFLELKESCQKRTKEATWLLEPMSQDMKVFMEQIRFTKLHQQTSNNKQIDLGELQGMEPLQLKDLLMTVVKKRNLRRETFSAGRLYIMLLLVMIFRS